jgi:UDP-glucose 4-epimerase
MASRGSVIPHFLDQIKSGKDITVTNPDMTRFMMTLDHAVELVLFAFKNGNSGDIFIQKSPASTIGELAIVLREIYKSNAKIKNIGIRHAEKMHETLLSKEEFLVAEDLGDYYRVAADNRDLNYNKYFSEGSSAVNMEEYNSFNTKRLSKEELKRLLSEIGIE